MKKRLLLYMPSPKEQREFMKTKYNKLKVLITNREKQEKL